MIRTVVAIPAGRPFGARNDCVIRAYAFAKDISYAESLDVWMERGFGQKRPWFWSSAPKVFGSRQCSRSGSLGKFIQNHPEGSFFVVIRSGGHAIAVKNGIVFDHREASPRQRVTAAWRIKP